MDFYTRKKVLLDSIKVGCYGIKNRIVMAPLTRCRANPNDGIPTDLHVKYYQDRSKEAGFVITECSSISKNGNSFPGSCGIFTKEQTEGWKKVTDAVHQVDGKIFLQIWHCGRSGLSQHLGRPPIAPSKIKNRFPAKLNSGFTEYEEPIEMTEDMIIEVLEQFKAGARNALEAGFDGIELHGANGYLIDNFLRDSSNQRTDIYGGSIENRCRFPLKVVDSLIEVFGCEKVGVKITPVGRLNDMFDSNPVELYKYFLRELSLRKIAFVELTKAPEFRAVPNLYNLKGEEQIPDVFRVFREFFDGVLIGNNSISFELAEDLIEKKIVDMVSFGRLFLANPDLVSRYKNDWPLNSPDEKTFYTPGDKGYNDYPFFKV